MALLWVLNLSDSQHDLLSIAERSGIQFGEISAAADALVECGLLKIIDADISREI
jgi:aminopeptidase-like protein